MHGTSPSMLSREHILHEVQRLKVAYALKRTLRYATTRDLSVHNESVAEHVFALFFLARYFLPIEDPDHTMDWHKVYDILLYHDFGEIKHGDVCFHLKTADDEERERVAAEEVFAALPSSMGKNARDSWTEYELRSTPEARFAYALDKLEPVFELFDEINQKSIAQLQVTYELYYEVKHRATSAFPHMEMFLRYMSEELQKRDVFWKPEMSIKA